MEAYLKRQEIREWQLEHTCTVVKVTLSNMLQATHSRGMNICKKKHHRNFIHSESTFYEVGDPCPGVALRSC